MKWLIPILCSMLLFNCVRPGSSPGAQDPFEIRAAWITRWGFKSHQDIAGLFRELDRMGINTVFFQVRGAGDALYRSALEPWSPVLSGTLGVDPGWDPLEAALTEAGKLDIEVHAWINMFPAWPVSESGDLPPRTEPLHVYHAHREWVARDVSGVPMPREKSEAEHNYVFLSPTHSGVQAHLEEVVEELAGSYELDGLHLDYMRFPDSTYSYDSDTRGTYRMYLEIEGLTETDLSFADWRRQNLTEFVGKLAGVARRTRPGIKVSAAVWQKIDSGKEYYFQDGVEWMKRGYLDFLVPMIYTSSVTSFEERLRAYAGSVGAHNVVAGLGPYLEGFTDSTVAAELDIARANKTRGFSIFNSDYAVEYSRVIRLYASDP